MSGLCLTAGKLLAAIPLTSFTLAWTTPGDDVRWEEQWLIAKGELRLLDSKKRGDGELALDPVLTGGDGTVKQWILVTTGPGAPMYEICVDGRCRPLVKLFPGLEPGSSIELSVCPDERE